MQIHCNKHGWKHSEHGELRWNSTTRKNDCDECTRADTENMESIKYDFPPPPNGVHDRRPKHENA